MQKLKVQNDRKPKPENVEFFSNTKDAILKGYRPCKVCKPLEKLNETPKYIQEIIDELVENPSLKFKDYDLVKRGIEPATMRRWFLKNHGITFQAYQRMFRINSAFKKIQQGETVTETALESGYESLSGFTESFKNVFGVSPKNSKNQKVIDLKRIETPLGTMYAAATDEGICMLEFTDRKMLETELKHLSKSLNANIIQGENSYTSSRWEEKGLPFPSTISFYLYSYSYFFNHMLVPLVCLLHKLAKIVLF